MENYTFIIHRAGESENELMHYGVRGMKWGVRRYQNADGTLTAAGKKRVLESGGYLSPKHKGKYVSFDNSHVRNKEAVRDEFIAEKEKLHGVEGKILSYNTKLELTKKYIDKYSDAVLSDLKLKNTEQAKNFVKQHFMYDENGRETQVGKDVAEINRREKIKNMSDKERQKAIDEVNAKFQKKWDELNKRYMEPGADRGKLDLEFDLVDAEWLHELDNLKR